MKSCPDCAEEIQSSAKVCRFCGHRFSDVEVLDAEKAQQSDDTWRAISKALPVVLILLFIWYCSQQSTTTESTDAQPLSGATVEACETLIEEAQRQGMVIERPSAERINVEDRLWADFPASSKKGLAMAVRCSSTGGTPGEMDYGVVYGYRSGKRLAMATSVGVKIE